MKMEMEKIGSNLQHRIRCIIWKQWKTVQNRIKSLMKLGINKEMAKVCSYVRKSYWATSKTYPVKLALKS